MKFWARQTKPGGWPPGHQACRLLLPSSATPSCTVSVLSSPCGLRQLPGILPPFWIPGSRTEDMRPVSWCCLGYERSWKMFLFSSQGRRWEGGGMNNALLTICNCHNHHIYPWPLSQTPGVILRPVFSLSIPFSLSFKISLIEPQCMKMIFKHSLRVYNVSLYQILCLHLSHFQLTTTLGWVLLCFCGCHDPGYLTQVLVYMGWALYHWAIPHPKGTVIKAMCQIIKSYLRSLRSARGQGAVVWIGNVTMDSATDDLLASW